jgi:RimJ/RimL family protein N-acetyltransferase
VTSSLTPQLGIRVGEIDLSEPTAFNTWCEEVNALCSHGTRSHEELRTFYLGKQPHRFWRAADAEGRTDGLLIAHRSALGFIGVHVNLYCRDWSIGTAGALLDALEASPLVDAEAPVPVLVHTKDPGPDEIPVLEKLGYEAQGWRYSCILDLAQPLVEVPAIHGISIVALRDRPDLARSVHEVWNSVHCNIPDMPPGAFPMPTYEEWLKEIEGETELPDGFFVAVGPDNDVAGIVFLDQHPTGPGILGTRITGTTDPWRGRGVATALKAHAAKWAQTAGYDRIKATNHSDNPAMIHINERLGYERVASQQAMRKDPGS